MKFKLYRFIVFSSAVMLIAGCGNDSSDVAKGEAALKSENFKTAAEKLGGVAKNKHLTSSFCYNLGVAKAKSGDVDGAIKSFDNALALDKNNIEALEYKASVLRDTGDFVTAHGLLEQAIEKTSVPLSKARLLNSLAVTEHALHRDDLACIRLNNAIRIAPKYAPSFYNLAKILGNSFQLHEEAINAVNLCNELLPSDDPMREKAAELALQLSNVMTPRKSDSTHKTSSAASKYLKQGLDAHAKSKWSLAEEMLKKAYDADPKSPEVISGLAATYYATARFSEAADAYAKAANILPRQFNPAFMQGRVAYSAGNHSRAIDILTRNVIPRWPIYRQSYEITAYAWTSMGRYYEAKVFGQQYIELSKIAGKDVSAFEKWFKTLPTTQFIPEI